MYEYNESITLWWDSKDFVEVITRLARNVFLAKLMFGYEIFLIKKFKKSKFLLPNIKKNFKNKNI